MAVDKSWEEAVRVERRDGVAVLTIDYPPVNALATPVTTGLRRRLDAALSDSEARAIVVTGARDNFVAGADIARLERLAAGREQPSDDAPLEPLLDVIESCPKPVVAAIDGVALGGGLELALACSARVGTQRARVGLPELQLGLIPGAGGTQRLPRLVGVAKAADMLLTSTQVRGPEAHALGILDELVDGSEELLERACAIARDIARGARPRRVALRETARLESPEQARSIVAALRTEMRKRVRNVDYPFYCLDAILEGAVNGPEAGMRRERELFLELLSSDVARGLMHMFFAERVAGKVPGVTDQGLSARKLARIGVLGGGTMGSGIATALLGAGLEVVLKEVDQKALAAGVARVEKNIARSRERGRTTAEQAEAMKQRLRGSTDYAGFDSLDMVIEAATEQVELKQAIFRDLDRVTAPAAILATNTSTIDIDVVGKYVQDKQRLVGTHFFSPAHVMKLVEVVRASETGKQTLVDTLSLTKAMKKVAVTVGNCPGFLVNRIFMPYSMATGFLIDRGVHPYRIDRALFAFGMPMGPCRMIDLAGIDVGINAQKIMDAAYSDRTYRSPLRKVLSEAGRLGEKTGKGHYDYTSGKPAEDPELERFIDEARRRAGALPAIDVSDEDIVRMTLFGVINEACRAQQEGIVIVASDIDVASVLGMGFPAYRGGPMKWADSIGAKVVHDSLARWHEQLAAPLFRPSELLASKAAQGQSLLGGSPAR